MNKRKRDDSSKNAFNFFQGRNFSLYEYLVKETGCFGAGFNLFKKIFNIADIRLHFFFFNKKVLSGYFVYACQVSAVVSLSQSRKQVFNSVEARERFKGGGTGVELDRWPCVVRVSDNSAEKLNIEGTFP